MPTPPPKKKKTTQTLKSPTGKIGTANLPPGKKRGKKGKKKAKNSIMPQVIGGVTLAAALGGMATIFYYTASKAVPEAVPVSAPAGPTVPRPSFEPTIRGSKPSRPGLAATMPDEAYWPQASDVTGTPVEPPVQGLLSKGVITVFQDGKFRPDAPLSRAQFVTWCYNAVMAQSVAGPDPFVSPKKAFPNTEPTGEEFGDVPADHWAAGVLASVKASGVLGDKLTNFFRPDAPLTREEWLVLASHFGSSTDAKASLTTEPDLAKLKVAYRKLNYTDFETIKPAYHGYAAYVFGDDKRKLWLDDTFGLPGTPGPWHPQKHVTRGEAASWIGSFYETIGNGSF